jgi:hypothetical protein
MKITMILVSSASVLLAQQYVISTFAGGAPPPTPVAAVSTSSLYPAPIAVDARNQYFSSSNCVFKVDVNGILTRVAGNSRQGYYGDGGLDLPPLFLPVITRETRV